MVCTPTGACRGTTAGSPLLVGALTAAYKHLTVLHDDAARALLTSSPACRPMSAAAPVQAIHLPYARSTASPACSCYKQRHARAWSMPPASQPTSCSSPVSSCPDSCLQTLTHAAYRCLQLHVAAASCTAGPAHQVVILCEQLPHRVLTQHLPRHQHLLHARLSRKLLQDTAPAPAINMSVSGSTARAMVCITCHCRVINAERLLDHRHTMLHEAQLAASCY
jgi:hypothetical protein